MMGRMAAPVMACRDKLGLAHVVSRKPMGKLGVFFLGHAYFDYPAAVRCVISFSHGKNLLSIAAGCGGISGVSRISRVWGRHSPTRFPQGQNERKANFGTAVESCSKKLPDCRSLPTATFSENL